MKDKAVLIEAGIDLETSMEFLGDMEMYEETLSDFLDELEERIPKMETYKQNGDMENYAILVHAIKSDAKYLGMKRLAELAYNHEMESKAGNPSYIVENSSILMNEIDCMIQISKKYLGI